MKRFIKALLIGLPIVASFMLASCQGAQSGAPADSDTIQILGTDTTVVSDTLNSEVSSMVQRGVVLERRSVWPASRRHERQQGVLYRLMHNAPSPEYHWLDVLEDIEQPCLLVGLPVPPSPAAIIVVVVFSLTALKG